MSAIVTCSAAIRLRFAATIYLGYLGYKAANVPLVKGIDPPPELEERPQQHFRKRQRIENLDSLQIRGCEIVAEGAEFARVVE